MAALIWVLMEGLSAPEETICREQSSASLEEETEQNVPEKKLIRPVGKT